MPAAASYSNSKIPNIGQGATYVIRACYTLGKPSTNTWSNKTKTKRTGYHTILNTAKKYNFEYCNYF